MIDHDNLEEFNDPSGYDIQYSGYEPEGPFYSALAHENGGPILELACGTGRVAIPLAEQGFAVTGIDLSQPMLRHAQHKSTHAPIHWILADCRDFSLKQRFGLIYMTGNAFQAFLTRVDQDALLEHVREHLRPDGFFALETRNPNLTELLQDQSSLVYDESYTDVRGHVIRTYESSYDPQTQVEHYTMHRRWHENEHEGEQISRIAIRYTFPDELDALLRDNGLTVLRRYGDWDLSALTSESARMIYVCGLRG